MACKCRAARSQASYGRGEWRADLHEAVVHDVEVCPQLQAGRGQAQAGGEVALGRRPQLRQLQLRRQLRKALVQMGTLLPPARAPNTRPRVSGATTPAGARRAAAPCAGCRRRSESTSTRRGAAGVRPGAARAGPVELLAATHVAAHQALAQPRHATEVLGRPLACKRKQPASGRSAPGSGGGGAAAAAHVQAAVTTTAPTHRRPRPGPATAAAWARGGAPPRAGRCARSRRVAQPPRPRRARGPRRRCSCAARQAAPPPRRQRRPLRRLLRLAVAVGAVVVLLLLARRSLP
eukprot:scaffold895_cov286-Prasinococcus_capsulatus_cf.AAC.7